MKRIINKVDWTLFAILLFAAFTPLLLKFYRFFLVSQIDNDTINFAVSWGYVNMIFEAVNIFVVVPAYWFIKHKANTQEEINRNMLIAILFTFLAFIAVFLMVIVLGSPIAHQSFMDNGGELLSIYEQSYIYHYIILYGFGISIHMFINLMIVYIIIHNKKLQAFLLTILTAITVMVSDSLFLNGSINPNAGLISIGASVTTSSIVMLIIITSFMFSHDFKAWKNSFKRISKQELSEGFKLYSKNGLYLGIEACIWNVLNIIGVTIWLDNATLETAFWTMDGIFWGFLLLPATAVSMFSAEGISNEADATGRIDVMRASALLCGIAVLSWVVLAPLLVFLVIPAALGGQEEIIAMTQNMCWIFIAFIAFQVPTRALYTYFSTTNRSSYLLIGTTIGASLTWGISLIAYLSGVELGENAYIIVPIIYGSGIVVIFFFYLGFYLFTRLDDENSPNLMNKLKEKMFEASKTK